MVKYQELEEEEEGHQHMAALPWVGPEPLLMQSRGHGNTLWLQVCGKGNPAG